MCFRRPSLEKSHNISQTRHFEHLRFPEDDFAAEGCVGTVRTHDDGAAGEFVVFLGDAVEVVAGCVCLADGAGSEVEDVVAVLGDVGVELCYAEMCPVAPDGGE